EDLSLASRRVNPPSIANSAASPGARVPTADPAGEFRTHLLELTADLGGLRFDQALARALPQYSRARLQGWIEAGEVEVDGRKLRAKDKVLGGERVRIH